MFVDKVRIKIAGGRGGDGCVSFHRAKYVVNGGPDGGDGGDGGDIIFCVDEQMATLLDFRYRRSFIAENGKNGGKNRCSGKSAPDLEIFVPRGTIVREAESGKIMADLSKAGERRVLIRGGRGGRGNQHFATASRQAPRYAERGRNSKAYEVVLELKTLADVGLIGLPNVGKSTLLSMVTNANPKIANYHFTTLSPNLGVVRNNYGEDFVLADIPGLIEGASEGAGLGADFLRHVERTKVFIHVVDAAASEGVDPVDAIEKINKELINYSELLAKRPQIVAANKMDILPDSEENLPKIKEYCEARDWQVFAISAAGAQGLDALMSAAHSLVKEQPEDITFEEDYVEEMPDLSQSAPFTISIPEDDYFVVEGVGVEKMLGYTNIETEKGNAFFQKYLKDKGIIAELEEKGIKEGDTVRIYDIEFEYFK
ncbi:MAG: GTPase ObgE [Clostridiales bacterium]|jgi:GTP-binding protein|nr:GTPase ObgE [Clostridiales bacterium]